MWSRCWVLAGLDGPGLDVLVSITWTKRSTTHWQIPCSGNHDTWSMSTHSSRANHISSPNVSAPSDMPNEISMRSNLLTMVFNASSILYSRSEIFLMKLFWSFCVEVINVCKLERDPMRLCPSLESGLGAVVAPSPATKILKSALCDSSGVIKDAMPPDVPEGPEELLSRLRVDGMFGRKGMGNRLVVWAKDGEVRMMQKPIQSPANFTSLKLTFFKR